MKLEETVAESMSHLLICKVTLLWNTIAYREISASDLSESDGPHYASAIARTAPSSKSSLNTSPTAIMTAIQALSTLLLHRAVDAQQPKHRPLPERYRHRIRARKRRSHYASAIARTASPSKSSLNTLSKAIITATQAFSTLMIHRAVDAQQPKHRPLPERYRHRI